MLQAELNSILKFYNLTDENGISNAEKAAVRAKVIRRIETTSKDKSFEEADRIEDESGYPIGIVVENEKLIGLGIHIFNEDVYPLKSFEIYLRNCDLVGSLDISKCKDMIFLDLYHNRISSVKLGNMPSMRILGLQDNCISEIDTTGLSACQGIDVGKNNIKCIDVSKNSELVELYINDNQFTSINLTENPKLKYFYCHNNSIAFLDTTGNPLLRHLDATGNPMKKIRCLAPQSEKSLPLILTAEGNGFVGLKFNPVYNAQWKETGQWQQSYYAYPCDGCAFKGWYDENGKLISKDVIWQDVYGMSRIITAVFADDKN